MMEFTMTRVVMVVCGMLVLAAVIPSVNSLYESEESIELQEQTECVCRMIDAFSTETSGIRDGFNSEIDARYFGKMADSEYAEAYFVKRFLL